MVPAFVSVEGRHQWTEPCEYLRDALGESAPKFGVSQKRFPAVGLTGQDANQRLRVWRSQTRKELGFIEFPWAC